MKKCSKCGIEKPLTQFYRHSTSCDGYRGDCKSCRMKYDALRYQKNRLQIDKKNKEWNASHPDAMQDTWRRYSHRNRNKRAIQARLRRAVRSGRITKPTVCSDCGCNDKIQAHHPDYGNALNVLWLCHHCHKAIHRKERSLV